MASKAPAFLMKLLNFTERAAAYAQGKGYGSTSIGREVDLILSLLPAAPRLAIDVGGNIGEYSAELRRRNPDLEIHTFEPASTNIAKLAERFDQDQRIHIIPCGLSDAASSATLYANEPGSGLGSLTRRNLDHLNVTFDHQEDVRLMRFDTYWAGELGSRPIDIVKIDVEGHEMATLAGFGDALDQTKLVQFEFGGCNIDTRTYFRDFWTFLTGKGFTIFRITPLGAAPVTRYRESDEFFSTTNFVAVAGR